MKRRFSHIFIVRLTVYFDKRSYCHDILHKIAEIKIARLTGTRHRQ